MATREMELLLPEERKIAEEQISSFCSNVGFSYKIAGNEGSSRKEGKAWAGNRPLRCTDVILLFAVVCCFDFPIISKRHNP